MNVRRAILDPYYNLLVGAQLINHKIAIYSDPARPGGPIDWIAPKPQTAMQWALVGSTFSTYGGSGPGGLRAGGATRRIYDRMMPGSDASAFVAGQPAIPATVLPGEIPLPSALA